MFLHTVKSVNYLQLYIIRGGGALLLFTRSANTIIVQTVKNKLIQDVDE